MSAIPHNVFFNLLDYKIKYAEEVLKKAYKDNNGNLFISFSGGKDSTILRHIALRLFPDLKVVFSNTTNELADVLKYIKTFPNVITVTPNMHFKKVVETHGFPLVSKEVSQKVNELKHTNGRITRHTRLYGDKKDNGKCPTKWRFLAEMPFDITHKCCSILKKNPLEKWAKNNGNPKPIIALMSDESRLRQQLSLYGSDNGDKIYPFLNTGWTEADIWAYAEKYNIRFAECYYDRFVNGTFVKGRTRTGCEFCGFGITLEKNDRFEASKIVSPKRYEKMMKLENNGVTFENAINIVKESTKKDTTLLLDIYGGVILSKKIDQHLGFDIYNWKPTTITKKCPRCESKNIKIDNLCVSNQRFYHTPHPQTGNKRKIDIENKMYFCENPECKCYFSNDLHLVNQTIGVTNSLIEYVIKNIDKKSEVEVLEETGIDFDTLWEIIHISPQFKNRIEKENHKYYYPNNITSIDFKLSKEYS